MKKRAQRAACSLPAGRTLLTGRTFVVKIDWDGTPMPCSRASRTIRLLSGFICGLTATTVAPVR